MSGIVVAYDGIDGCGKDKQIELTKKRIESEYPRVNIIVHQEPWRSKESPFGTYIDRVLRHEIADISPIDDPSSFQKYYTADRFLLWSLRIQDELEQGDQFNVILLSRDRMSTMAFGLAFGLPLEEVIKWHRYIPLPDLYLFLRVSAKTAMKRIKKRDGDKTEYFEKEQRLEQIATAYEKALVYGQISNIYQVDGEASAEEVNELLMPIVHENLPLAISS